MGLDAYMYKGRLIVCPNCGRVIETIYDEDEADCYWRNNHDLENYINDNIAPHENGKNIELNFDDLVKINKAVFASESIYYNSDKILKLIGYLSTNKNHVVIYYSDW